MGIADGIDTSDKNAKLTFTMKSMVADFYIEDLRDKTLRGKQGRAKAGFATGNVAYGFYTVPLKNERGEVVGNKIEIHEAEAKVVIRIFRSYRDGASLTGIAHALNREGVPSPRVGSRHSAYGWGSSTIRAMLRNERYIGIWRFGEKQWVKVPGTNKRRPRPRAANEQIVQHRPELRIVDAVLWAAAQERVQAVAKVYKAGGASPGCSAAVQTSSSRVSSSARGADRRCRSRLDRAPRTTAARPTRPRARAPTACRFARTSPG